jgi:hypothetical protein
MTGGDRRRGRGAVTSARVHPLVSGARAGARLASLA